MKFLAAALPLGALLMDGHWGFFLDEGLMLILALSPLTPAGTQSFGEAFRSCLDYVGS